MTQSDAARLQRFGFLALAGVALLVLAFELSHDFSLWWIASGVVGIPVLVAAAFSLVGRATLFATGGIVAGLLAVSSLRNGNYILGSFVGFAAVGLLWQGFDLWRNRT